MADAELRLTDDQISDLEAMGLSGRIAANELRIWRAALPAPWVHNADSGKCFTSIFKPGEAYDADDPDRWTHVFETCVDGSDHDVLAVCHSRNNAELRAAAEYWCGVASMAFNSDDDATYIRARERLEAIEREYEALERGA